MGGPSSSGGVCTPSPPDEDHGQGILPVTPDISHSPCCCCCGYARQVPNIPFTTCPVSSQSRISTLGRRSYLSGLITS